MGAQENGDKPLFADLCFLHGVGFVHTPDEGVLIETICDCTVYVVLHPRRGGGCIQFSNAENQFKPGSECGFTFPVNNGILKFCERIETRKRVRLDKLIISLGLDEASFRKTASRNSETERDVGNLRGNEAIADAG